MKSQRAVFKDIFWMLILLTLFGCQNIPAPTAVPIPSPTPNLTPQPTDIVLQYPKELSPDNHLFIEVHNKGNLPYVFYQPAGDNCLYIQIKGAEGQYFQTSPPACDVMAAYFVKPGEKTLLGNWDLNECKDVDCLERIPASPNEYFISATFYPFIGDITKIDASSDEDYGPGIEVTATFTLTD